MARTENQKLKALYIAKYIMEYSDENHDFTATDIILLHHFVFPWYSLLNV